MKDGRIGARSLALGSLLTMFACAGNSDSSDGSPRASTAAIIGGVSANGAGLNTIAALAFAYDHGDGTSSIEPFCTVALIGPQTFVTAKHCVDRLYWSYGARAVVALGPNAQDPARIIDIVDAERASGNISTVIGNARDVGVVHVHEFMPELTPLEPSELEPADIGAKFVAVGYGVRDESSNHGTRRAGTLTLRALKGRFYELVFGSFDNFKEWYESRGFTGVLIAESVLIKPGAESVSCEELGVLIPGDITECASPVQRADDDSLRDLYENTWLGTGAEAWLGAARGNAQPCFGDSGGPLIRKVGAQLRTYGVTSGGLSSRDLICNYGAVYAVFGPEVLAFLDEARSWRDPCGDVPSAGVCDGDLARRCTFPFSEGKRRIVETDCSLLRQTCGQDERGELGCVDPQP